MKNIQINYKVWFWLSIFNIFIFIKNLVIIIASGMNVLNLIAIVASLIASILLIIPYFKSKREKT